MIIRLIEQMLASGVTFATSMVALRVLDSESLSLFFLLLSGSQIAVVILAARRISVFIQSSGSVGLSYLIGGKAILEVVFASVAVTLIVLMLLCLSFNSSRINLDIALPLLLFTMMHLLVEWLRRTFAVICTGKFHPFLPAIQLFRMIGPLFLFSINNSSGAIIFFGVLSFVALLTVSLYILLLKNRFLGHIEKKNSNNAVLQSWPKIDKNVLVEIYNMLAWANIPIASLAIIGGNAGISRLVEVRTPLSFLNPIIEFIEIHVRKLKNENLWKYTVLIKVAVVFCFWIIFSVLILIFGDQVTSLVSGRPISGIAFDMVIFWWLQLMLIVDRITHNVERTKAANQTQIASTLGLSALLLLMTILMIWLFGVTGCTFAMLLWSLVNIVFRFSSGVLR